MLAIDAAGEALLGEGDIVLNGSDAGLGLLVGVGNHGVGAGAGFDTRLAGKTWITSTTMDDTRAACRSFDMTPLYNMGLPDLTCLTPELNITGEMRVEKEGKRRVFTNTLHTGKGDLTSVTIEEELMGVCPVKAYIGVDEDDPDTGQREKDDILRHLFFQAFVGHSVAAVIHDDGLARVALDIGERLGQYLGAVRVLELFGHSFSLLFFRVRQPPFRR